MQKFQPNKQGWECGKNNKNKQKTLPREPEPMGDARI
jgi:hypothetical protein